MRKRSLGAFNSFIIQRKSPGHEVAAQGLKSCNAITVRGLTLLSGETNEIFRQHLPDFRGLTLKIVKHNSQYIVTREPTIILYSESCGTCTMSGDDIVQHVLGCSSSDSFCNISTCFMHIVTWTSILETTQDLAVSIANTRV